MQTHETTSTTPSTEETGIAASAISLWEELRGLMHDHVQLAMLETKQAGKSLVVILAASVLIAFLIMSVWCGLMALVIIALVNSNIALTIAIGITIILNVLGILILYAFIRYHTQFLKWKASIRRLRLMSVSEPEKQTQEIKNG
jgi:uncharacterized membrane protein YqjE